MSKKSSKVNSEDSIETELSSINLSKSDNEIQEINLVKSSKKISTEDQISKDIKNIKLQYGRYKILTTDTNGEPYLVLGPDYWFFIGLLIFDLLFVFFINSVLFQFVNAYVSFIGIMISLTQVFIYIFCSLKNPGLPKKEYQTKALLSSDISNYKRCRECGFIVDISKNYDHCYTCGVCCEGYDHHCPWTTKCVGARNIYWFYAMITSVIVVFFYIIFEVMFMAFSDDDDKPKKGIKH